MYRPTASKQVGQYFEPLKTFLKKKKKRHLGNVSEHLKCVIPSNLKNYLSCDLGD